MKRQMKRVGLAVALCLPGGFLLSSAWSAPAACDVFSYTPTMFTSYEVGSQVGVVRYGTVADQGLEDLAGDGPFEGAVHRWDGPALLDAAVAVGAGGGVVADPVGRDAMQGVGLMLNGQSRTVPNEAGLLGHT